MTSNLILHITTACNYDCSYCDVIKDNKRISKEKFWVILEFIKNNYTEIERFKFFGGEPLLNWKGVKYIIDHSKKYLPKNFEMVTNTTFLKDEVGEYFQKYFAIIFFSIDSENNFDYEKIKTFSQRYKLEKKLYFNLIIDPEGIQIAKQQFQKLYELGFRGFNILPVYFTKNWNKSQLQEFSHIMKSILDLSVEDKDLRLYGFTENTGENTSLINNSFFINTDLEVYFSDMPSTFLGQKIRKKLFLGNVENFSLQIDNDFELQKKAISELEKSVYTRVKGQQELHKIMDYFSQYLNKKNAK